VQGQLGVWLPTEGLLSHLLRALVETLGAEGLALALQDAGRLDADGPLPAHGQPFAEQFEAWRCVQLATGRGDLRLVELDQVRQEVVVQARQHWEGLIQARLGRCWGSAVLMGQLAGLCSRHFGRPCQARQIRFVALGDSCDEFVVQADEGPASSAVPARERPAPWSVVRGRPPAAAVAPLRVMMVGVDAVNTELMRQLTAVLPSVSLEVAASGSLALSGARQAPPELMLVDLPLGDMGAPELARQLRQDPRTQAVRLVGLVSGLPPAHLEPALPPGFAQVLTKPINFAVLLPLLEACRHRG